MMYEVIKDITQIKSIIFEHVNLLEGLLPEVLDCHGNTPRMDWLCKPNSDAIRKITIGKNIYNHIDIFGNNNTITYDMGTKKIFDCFVVCSMSLYCVGEMEVYASCAKENLYDVENRIGCIYHDSAKISVFEDNGMDALVLNETQARYIGFRILKGSVKDDIFRPVLLMVTHRGSKEIKTISNYQLKVETSKIVNQNFYGTGTNLIPMHLMPENVEMGFTESHFSLLTAALTRLKSNVVRLWFQVDWITDNYENYKNGIYTFHSEKFETVCRFIEILRNSGSEVLLNFGWKTAEPVSDWFSFEQTHFDSYKSKMCSAPKELDLFAKACAATVQELILQRQFHNIKYLTFYNEPCPCGDFCTPFGKKEDKYESDSEAVRLNAKYWRKMVDYVDEELKNIGIRDRVALWGPELTIPMGFDIRPKYFTWLEEEENSPLEVMTYHRYHTRSSEVKQHIEAVRYHTDKPLVVTEYATDNVDLCWDSNVAQHFIDKANAGFSGMLMWLVSAPSRFTAPLLLQFEPNVPRIADGERMIEVYVNNKLGQRDAHVQPVSHTYPLHAMFNHYVPSHSKVLQTGEDCEGLRYAAFITPTDDYTVIVEIKNTEQGGHFSINFDKEIGRTFYLHKYCKEKHYEVKLEDKINGMIPPCCDLFKVNNTLSYDFDGQYGVYCFTTMNSIPQVCIDSEKNYIPAGGTVKLSATPIDAEGEIEWFVVAGDGMVDSDGVATMPDTAVKDDIFAVKAQLKGTNAYAVAIVICE